MSTTTNVEQLKLNVMTKQQYDIATKSPTELYMVTDATMTAAEVGAIPQVSSLPAATSALAGCIYQYVGTTTATYINGYFYKCVNNSGTYSWIRINVQPDHSNVSNCIIDIPQDIALELSSGTLTLRAGSKVYVPNGSGVFDEVVIASDLSVTPTWLNNKLGVVYYRRANNNITVTSIDYCFSGSTAPTYADGGCWYDTTNNKIKRGISGSWVDTDESSLPIAIVKDSSNVVTSIDQVFNGFGYIGSVIFALPGVRGLIPDGINPDGTLNSQIITVPDVWVSSNTGASCDGMWLSTTDFNRVAISTYRYIEEKNYWISIADGNIRPIIYIGHTTGDISTFSPRYIFQAVDYSDTAFIAHQAMPSSRYNTLTLGASGSNYTAPADGWFVLLKGAGTSGAYCNLVNTTAHIGVTSDGMATGAKYIYIPASRGDVIQIAYSFSGTTESFIFVYANGAV